MSIPSHSHILNGVIVPKFVQQERLDQLKSIKLYPDDIWIVTYPKCGTTWTQQIVKMIRNKGQEDGVKIFDSVPWLEPIEAIPGMGTNLDNLDKLARPRAFKSHNSYDHLPCGPPHTTPCKYIYVLRNPKDVAVAYFYHEKYGHKLDTSFDDFFEIFMDGALEYGRYFDHVLSFLPHRNDKNILFMRYESMKKHPGAAVSQIAAFMGVELSEEDITKIVDMTSFEKMKKDNTVNMSWLGPKLFKDEEGRPMFIRKGVIGDWKNHFTAEQSNRIEAACAEKFKGTGLEFEFE